MPNGKKKYKKWPKYETLLITKIGQKYEKWAIRKTVKNMQNVQKMRNMRKKYNNDQNF